MLQKQKVMQLLFGCEVTHSSLLMFWCTLYSEEVGVFKHKQHSDTKRPLFITQSVPLNYTWQSVWVTFTKMVCLLCLFEVKKSNIPLEILMILSQIPLSSQSVLTFNWHNSDLHLSPNSHRITWRCCETLSPVMFNLSITWKSQTNFMLRDNESL